MQFIRSKKRAVMSTDKETPQAHPPPFRAKREIWPCVIAYIQLFSITPLKPGWIYRLARNGGISELLRCIAKAL